MYKEKAKEIIEKYKPYVYPYAGSGFMTDWQDDGIILMNAKRCAKLEVEGIIEALDNYDECTGQHLKEEFGINFFSAELQNMDGDFRYWYAVLKAIENYEK